MTDKALSDLTDAGDLAAGDKVYVVRGGNSRQATYRGASTLISNGTFVATANGGALTIALKTLAGTDPTSSDAVTVTLPDWTTNNITAALSVTVPSGATLGVSNGTPFRLWCALVYDAGTWRIAVRQCTSATEVSGFPGNGRLSSTALSTSSDSAGVTYTDSAVTAKQFVIAAICEFDSGLATAGVWTDPTRTFGYMPDMARPGDVVQGPLTASHATSESTSSTSYTDTSLTKAITPTSPCNPVAVIYDATVGQDTASKHAYYIIRRGGSNIGNPKDIFSTGTVLITSVGDAILDRPGATSAQTYTLAYKTDSGGNAFHCANSGGSSLSVAELMG